MARVEFCIAASEGHAEQIVGGLRAAGISGDDIAVLFPDRDLDPRRCVARGWGSVRGGRLARLAGTSTVAIPGLGLFVAAGPLLGAVGDATDEQPVGGLSRALSCMGIPERVARHYEASVRRGRFLIAVNTTRGRERSDVIRIFERAGAEDVVTTIDVSASTVSPSRARIAPARTA